MAVVEDALQTKAVGDGRMNGSRRTTPRFALQDNALHLEVVFFEDVEAVARRIGAGILGVEEGQQHAAGFKHRP